MSYRIEYAPDSGNLQKTNGYFPMRLLMTLTVFVLFLFCIRSERPDAWAGLQEWFWPGEAAVTRNAAKILWMDLRAGQPVSQAAAAFCRDILYHAGIR